MEDSPTSLTGPDFRVAQYLTGADWAFVVAIVNVVVSTGCNVWGGGFGQPSLSLLPLPIGVLDLLVPGHKSRGISLELAIGLVGRLLGQATTEGSPVHSPVLRCPSSSATP